MDDSRKYVEGEAGKLYTLDSREVWRGVKMTE